MSMPRVRVIFACINPVKICRIIAGKAENIEKII
jgi:hypothetical protein